MTAAAPTNRLARETSPYLLQHASNPVDWYPWGPEAFEVARREDRPILLSIGYAACHWCHVMERESFEDPETARLMNESFVCVKVDREERPDLDEIYMIVVQSMTGSGGWPMTVFLTPEGKPFYGGTYFPPEDRYGRPGFRSLLQALTRAYRERRAEVARGAEGWSGQLQQVVSASSSVPVETLGWGLIDAAVDRMTQTFDPIHGGFGCGSKFPHSMDLGLFLRTYRRTGRLDLMLQVRKSLEAMAAGGLHDQLGGGFHRYTVDERWSVPHFEKMLYDNALLAGTYLDACALTGDAGFGRVARSTLDFLLAEMRDPAGGFWSSQDADSAGEEGTYYLWDPDQVEAVLGHDDARIVCACLGIGPEGNFSPGKTVPYRARTTADVAADLERSPDEVELILADGRLKLLEARRRRVRPSTDDKVLACWNGLTISALVAGHRTLEDPTYLDAARAAAQFLTTRMVDSRGRLMRSFRRGQARAEGYLEDYGAVMVALLDLYEATFETHWVHEARRLYSVLIERFWDDQAGEFCFAAGDAEPLLVRTRPYQDSATPSGNSLAAMALLRLGRLTGDPEPLARAATVLERASGMMAAAPAAFPYLLTALDLHLTPPVSVVVAGDPALPATRELIRAARRRWNPGLAVALAAPPAATADMPTLPVVNVSERPVSTVRVPGVTEMPILEGKAPVDGRPVAYICRDFTCEAPVTNPTALESMLSRI